MQNKKKMDLKIRTMCYMIPFYIHSGQGMALGQEKKNLPTDVSVKFSSIQLLSRVRLFMIP